MRDEFSKKVRESLAHRAGVQCSNPGCCRATSGPAEHPKRSLSIGVAAHINAASPGGPRYDPVQTRETRTSLDNAIWLCQSCAKLIDIDRDRFHPALLRQWRFDAETAASLALSVVSGYRSITPAEVSAEFTRGEYLALFALEKELGCRLATAVYVPTTEGGWLSLNAAAVHGDTLVGVDLRKFDGRGIAYFQIEYLIELGERLRFPHFDGLELWILVVSTAPVTSEAAVIARLSDLGAAAAFPVRSRFYRVPELEAQFGSVDPAELKRR